MGTMSLFGDIEESVDFIPVPNVEDLSEDDKLKDEKEYTGFYITGHPLQGYAKELEGLFETGGSRRKSRAIRWSNHYLWRLD